MSRLWDSLLAVCLPLALGTIAWVVVTGARPVGAELAGAYLLIVIAGRAQAAERARREKPARLARVRSQIDLVKAHMPLGVLAVEPVREGSSVKLPPVETRPWELTIAEMSAFSGVPVYDPTRRIAIPAASGLAEASAEAA